MRVGIRVGLAAGLWLAACGNPIPVQAPVTEDLAGEAIPVRGDSPPALPQGACWGHDTIPAVIETVTDTVLVTPEERGADGKLTRPASYASESRQRMVQDRATVWIRTPCYNQLTPDTILILQRALIARGFYAGVLSGELDAATQLAVRKYQAAHGLDTPVLSLKAAEALGLVSVERSSL